MTILSGTNLGPPPLQENQGAVTHRSHHKITNWKSLLQPHCKGIGLDLPDAPCDLNVATCQGARGREGHSLSWQHRHCLAPSPNAKAASGRHAAISNDSLAWMRVVSVPMFGALPLSAAHSFFHGEAVIGGSCSPWSYRLPHLLPYLPLVTSDCAAGFAFAISWAV